MVYDVLLGRLIAVDWALSKDRYQKAVERERSLGTVCLYVHLLLQFCCFNALLY